MTSHALTRVRTGLTGFISAAAMLVVLTGCETVGGLSYVGVSGGYPYGAYGGYPYGPPPWIGPYPPFYRPHLNPFYYSTPFPYAFRPYSGPSFRFYGAHPRHRHGPRWGGGPRWYRR